MMTAQRIQVGQVWRKLETGETFLVTKLYNEALATIAVLRPTGAATESMIRVRVDRQGGNQGLPGFSMAQEGESRQLRWGLYFYAERSKRSVEPAGKRPELHGSHLERHNVFHLHHFLRQERLGIFNSRHLSIVARDQVHLVVQSVEGDIHFRLLVFALGA